MRPGILPSAHLIRNEDYFDCEEALLKLTEKCDSTAKAANQACCAQHPPTIGWRTTEEFQIHIQRAVNLPEDADQRASIGQIIKDSLAHTRDVKLKR
jgi:hypothetical protein